MLKELVRYFKREERGFTLVELLAVIVILSIILAIAIPTVGNVIENSREKAHEANMDLIEEAARLVHASDNINEVDTDGNNQLSVSELNEADYLDTIPKHPKTDKDYNGYVEIPENGSEFNYTEGSEVNEITE